MVERIHIGGPQLALIIYSVEMLPYRRRAESNGIEPRRILFAKKQFVSDVDMSRLRERVKNVRRAEKARLPAGLARSAIYDG